MINELPLLVFGFQSVFIWENSLSETEHF
ncbi:hypothetical protein EG68_11745 [Paragonimus skrjabini miyazakii]|uniref:Uncharacterized protein n=1 Tax=Paragonimus skrjabini miyazakii TaxID=59628 RepID=A0A8S9YIC6_9TREM|nr:hypothetical protein EG68_11745 [Paragonimus skrjabini miyazakii]